MTTDDKITDEKYQHYHHVKLVNMNILLIKKYYLPVKVEL